jgi:hypothetical protein
LAFRGLCWLNILQFPNIDKYRSKLFLAWYICLTMLII